MLKTAENQANSKEAGVMVGVVPHKWSLNTRKQESNKRNSTWSQEGYKVAILCWKLLLLEEEVQHYRHNTGVAKIKPHTILQLSGN